VAGFISRTLSRTGGGLGVIVLPNGVADAVKLAMDLAMLAAGALRGRPNRRAPTGPVTARSGPASRRLPSCVFDRLSRSAPACPTAGLAIPSRLAYTGGHRDLLGIVG
jgi:hypothetical protein